MNRGSFLTSSVSLASAAIPGGSRLVETSADFDHAAFDRAVGKPARIRQLFEAVSFHPAFLNNVKNALNGLQFGFGYPPGAIAMVVAAHGPSSAYTYSQYVWKTYRIGDAFALKDAGGAAVASNVFLAPAQPPKRSADPDDPAGFYQDVSIETLQQRGVVFLTCHTAVEEQARNLVKGGFAPAGSSPQSVADDILRHLIPGTHVVPAMVAAIAVLQQRYRYAYTTVDFV